MIRILNVITRLNIAGGTIHVLEITRLFNDDIHSSKIVYGNVEPHEQDMLYLAREYGLDLINVPSMGRSINPLLDLKLVWQVYRIMRREKPDIVHTHTAKAGYAGRLAAWLAGVPVIVHTFHGNNFKGYFGKVMTAVSINTERFLARISTRIIAISEQQREELLSYRIAPPDKISVIHLGFDFTKVIHSVEDKGRFKQAYSIGGNQHLVAFVGRLAPIKNPFALIRIAELVLAGCDDVVFAFVGDGELAESLKAEVRRLGYQERIIFTGFIRDLRPLYADAGLLLLTSHNEGTPVAIIEAMANRVLVIASRVGGIPNLITDSESGILLPPEDEAAFATTILAALEHPERYAAMRERAYQRITAEYSTTRLKSELGRLFGQGALKTSGK
jgi:glycosyltransferase involved in cell wall biosynthesis